MGLKHQAASARKWHAAIRQTKRHFPAELPGLLFLTDPVRVPELVSVANALPTGSGVIYRHFGAEDCKTVAEALQTVCRHRGLMLLIAADPRLAKQIGADGVHWPEKRLPEARSWREHFRLQTTSAHSAAAIHRAERIGMDAALVSSVFPSDSPSAGSPLNPARFRQLSAKTSIPLYGLGGLNAQNAAAISASGGLAAIGSLVETFARR